MVAVRQGVVASWRRLSDVLGLLRLLPEPGSRFPGYEAGQYIALRHENCRLTRRVMDAAGRVRYVTDYDASGAPRRGPVTHSYSISSAPFETARDGHLEFYIILERDEEGEQGRLTESLFQLKPEAGDPVSYFERITGDFTLERRARGFEHVLMVGTGTGLAPFASMAKQLHHEALQGRRDSVRHTLLHANRTPAELAYHEELSAIAWASVFDFVYVGSVSRPQPDDVADTRLGAGRANNLLRDVLGLPLREEEDRAAEDVLQAVRPRLPSNVSREQLLERLPPAHTVVLTCGNPAAMEDVRLIAERVGMRFEKEDWKVTRRP